jgi:hypothetical protein
MLETDVAYLGFIAFGDDDFKIIELHDEFFDGETFPATVSELCPGFINFV